MKQIDIIEEPLNDNISYEAPQIAKSEYMSLRQCLNTALGTLGPREERVLRRLFLQDKTVSEVAVLEGVTGSYIRHIRSKALRKLVHPSRSKHLRDFLAA